MIQKRSQRLLAATTAVGLVMGTTLLTAGPASAVAGDASAIGIGVDIDAGVLSAIGASVDASVGGVSVTSGSEPAESEVLGADASIGSLLAAAGASAVRTSASSGNAGSEATAEVDGLDIDLLGYENAIVSNGTLSATAICSVGAEASAEAVIEGLSVFGTSFTADDLGVATTVDLTGDLLGADLTVTISQVEDATTTDALATSLLATVTFGGALPNIPVIDVTGTIVIASAECERPDIEFSLLDMTPVAGPTAGGQEVTFTGTGFTSDTTVTFAGIPATSVTVAPSGESLVAVTPPGTVGDTTAVITSGESSDSRDYEYLAPTIASATPLTGPEAGDTEVTITGTGLGDTETVFFGEDEGEIVSVSDTEVVVLTPGGIGTVPVTVISSTGVEVAVPQDFVYEAPAIAGFTPTGGPEAGGNTVTLTGNGLGDTETVFFGDEEADIVSVSETTVVVLAPAGTGYVPVSLELGDGRTVEAPGDYRYIAADDRSIVNLDPRQGPAAGGALVTITGTALNDVEVVTFGANEAEIVSVSADGSTVVVRTPAGAPGFVPVGLVFSDDSELDAGDYLYIDQASPVVGGITPSTGPTSGGTTVIITGDHLDGVTEVTFDGVPGTIVGTPTNGSITVITPAGAAGDADVVLTSAYGSALVEDGFTYVSTAAAGSGKGLASTGVSTPVGPSLLAALLLLVFGGTLAGYRMRKRTV